MVDEVADRSVRRRSRRRAGMSDSTVTEGGGVADLNDDVEERATYRPVAERLSDAESNVGSRTDAPEDFTPANRMKDVGARATAYEREYRLKLIHRMLMRNVPLDQIAKELDLSLSTIVRDRRELYKRLRDAAQKLNLNEIIGDTMGFYQEVRGMGLRAASASKAPLNMRLAAMRTSLAATNDMHRFLDAVGVYDVLRYRVSDEESASDIERLVAITETLLGGDAEASAETKMSDIPYLNDEDEIEMLR